MKLDKNLNIGLAGEMRVCSELLKKGLDASITFGNAKATDIIVMSSDNRFVRIEVKTSKNGRNFVTGYYPKYTDASTKHPDIWVFYLPEGDRFFIATHEEVAELQLKVNGGSKTLKGQGCDNIPVNILVQDKSKFENQWEKIGTILSENNRLD